MHKSNSRRPALAAFALLFTLAVALPIAGQTAAAEQSLTLRGDPAEEAKEREDLFASLADAKDATEAQPIIAQVWALWFRAPAAAARLMERALERRSAGDYSGAVGREFAVSYEPHEACLDGDDPIDLMRRLPETCDFAN